MVFRDLQLFNDTMLAKQPWRLLERPGSLCARVLKGRYYPDGEILNAHCPNSVSATWRAICRGREVLKKGLIRRIGDGATCEIWHDRWIYGTHSMRPMGRLSDVPVQLVSDLFVEDSNQLNTDLVREVFFAPDADAIYS